MTQKAYGIIAIHKSKKGSHLLAVCSRSGVWGFPKGRPDDGSEAPLATALRELAEETGITDISIIDNMILHEEYQLPIGMGGDKKVVQYFVGYTSQTEVVLQEDELSNFRWITVGEGDELMRYPSRKKLLERTEQLLIKNKYI